MHDEIHKRTRNVGGIDEKMIQAKRMNKLKTKKVLEDILLSKIYFLAFCSFPINPPC